MYEELKSIAQDETHARLIRGDNIYHDAHRKLIEQFTGKQLSHPGDRLDAFLGIYSSVFAHDLADEQISALSGLPLNLFVTFLCWAPVHDTPATRIQFDQRRSRVLPSWS